MGTGQLIADRFEIEREAGAGGMARVFLALDRTNGARVAPCGSSVSRKSSESRSQPGNAIALTEAPFTRSDARFSSALGNVTENVVPVAAVE